MQDCDDYEWIVVDADSRDGTSNWLGGVFSRSKSAPLTGRFISEPDRGLYDGMNKGLELAGGRYVVFMNAGDRFYDKGTLTEVRDMLYNCTEMPALLYGDAYETGIGIASAQEPFCPAPLLPCIHQSIYYERSSIGGLTYDLAYGVAADYKWSMQFAMNALRCDRVICRVNLPLCIFEGGGLSYRHAHQGRKEVFLIRQDLGIYEPPMNRLYDFRHRIGWFLRSAFPAGYAVLRDLLRRRRIWRA